ncbi:hypothetical protein Ddye_006781 [Dipteronia dyeriana]|uniref:Glycosyltransferase n=1 Tax=Dipteronia dyeriana TaxID=168575 RepID=A0AAD9XJP6_9ROSI|nr:hypothetical protein Ddye_006781 [Dipteronia dyeriana]
MHKHSLNTAQSIGLFVDRARALMHVGCHQCHAACGSQETKILMKQESSLAYTNHGKRKSSPKSPLHPLLDNKSLDATNKAITCGHRINVHVLKFPFKESDLPEGLENFSYVISDEHRHNIAKGIFLLQQPIEQFIRDNRPDFIVADMFHFWLSDLASDLGIPRLTSHGMGHFGLCAEDCLFRYESHKTVQSDKEPFLLPGLPGQIQMTRSEIADWIKVPDAFTGLINMINKSIEKSYGVLVNSFYELEKDCADHYRNVLGMKSWSIGSVRLFNARYDSGNDDKHDCLTWLHSQNPNSVVYVSFGSLCSFSSAQTSEIAQALDSMNHPFIWVVRKEDRENEWLPRELEEKITKSSKGLIINGWAPQLSILEHPAVGGFLTHCGWNSVLETIAAEVPMATWPLGADQFYNEKLITQVLGVGVKVGSEVWTQLLEESRSYVEKEKIEKAVNELMGGGEEAEMRRKKVKELSVIAKAAVKDGGSSYSSVTALLDELRQCR